MIIVVVEDFQQVVELLVVELVVADMYWNVGPIPSFCF